MTNKYTIELVRDRRRMRMGYVWQCSDGKTRLLKEACVRKRLRRQKLQPRYMVARVSAALSKDGRLGRWVHLRGFQGGEWVDNGDLDPCHRIAHGP